MTKTCHNCGITVSENAKFCAGCGSVLQHETSQLVPQNLNVIKNAKKGFGVGAKIGLVLGVILFLIIAIGATGSSSHTSTNTDSSNVPSLDHQAISLVQNYKGSSGTGYSIVQVVTLIINVAYPGEDIFGNPSTEHGWVALRDYTQNGNVWKVEFDFKTYRENVGIAWYANMDTHAVYSGDTTAKNILDIVNLPSNSVNNSTLSQVHLT